MAITTVNDGLFRFGGMYGAAYDPGAPGQGPVLLTDVIEVTGNVEINRLEVPLVGQTKQGYKPGRESREGSVRIQKIDTEWEMKVYRFLTQGLADRRAARNRGEASLRPFNILIEVDDPDALGVEKWLLEGCLIWRMPLGFSITDDILDREFPLTWEKETPYYAFNATKNADGSWKAEYYAPPLTIGGVPRG